MLKYCKTLAGFDPKQTINYHQIYVVDAIFQVA